jgi:hypothetical protein
MTRRRLHVKLFCFALLAIHPQAYQPRAHRRLEPTCLRADSLSSCETTTPLTECTRRKILSQAAPAIVALLSSVVVDTNLSSQPAYAAATKLSGPGVIPTLTIEQAKTRLVEARQSLLQAQKAFPQIMQQTGRGDAIRRYLGTVGTTSGMVGIDKALRVLREAVDDPVEWNEAVIEFEIALRAADTAAYSSNFVEYSAAKTKPEVFLEDTRKEIDVMIKLMNEMGNQLGIEWEKVE